MRTLPEHPPSEYFVTEDERDLYRSLRAEGSSDLTAVLGFGLDGLEIDAVILSEEAGLVIIETKDLAAFTYTPRHSLFDPWGQAQRHRWDLLRVLAERLEYLRGDTSDTRPHKVSSTEMKSRKREQPVPVTWCVRLRHHTRETLETAGAGELLDRTITAEDTAVGARAEEIALSALRGKIDEHKGTQGKWAAWKGLTVEDRRRILDRVAKWMNPEFRLNARINLRNAALGVQDDLTADVSEELRRVRNHRHVAVVGAAGTGKSWLGIQRALECVNGTDGQPPGNALYLAGSAPSVDQVSKTVLQLAYGGLERLTIATPDAFLHSQYERLASDASEELEPLLGLIIKALDSFEGEPWSMTRSGNDRLWSAIADLASTGLRFDLVVVDEAQLLTEHAIRSVERLCPAEPGSDGRDSQVLLLADPMQFTMERQLQAPTPLTFREWRWPDDYTFIEMYHQRRSTARLHEALDHIEPNRMRSSPVTADGPIPTIAYHRGFPAQCIEEVLRRWVFEDEIPPEEIIIIVDSSLALGNELGSDTLMNWWQHSNMTLSRDLWRDPTLPDIRVFLASSCHGVEATAALVVLFGTDFEVNLLYDLLEESGPDEIPSAGPESLSPPNHHRRQPEHTTAGPDASRENRSRIFSRTPLKETKSLPELLASMAGMVQVSNEKLPPGIQDYLRRGDPPEAAIVPSAEELMMERLLYVALSRSRSHLTVIHGQYDRHGPYHLTGSWPIPIASHTEEALAEDEALENLCSLHEGNAQRVIASVFTPLWISATLPGPDEDGSLEAPYGRDFEDDYLHDYGDRPSWVLRVLDTPTRNWVEGALASATEVIRAYGGQAPESLENKPVITAYWPTTLLGCPVPTNPIPWTPHTNEVALDWSCAQQAALWPESSPGMLVGLLRSALTNCSLPSEPVSSAPRTASPEWKTLKADPGSTLGLIESLAHGLLPSFLEALNLEFLDPEQVFRAGRLKSLDSAREQWGVKSQRVAEDPEDQVRWLMGLWNLSAEKRFTDDEMRREWLGMPSAPTTIKSDYEYGEAVWIDAFFRRVAIGNGEAPTVEEIAQHPLMEALIPPTEWSPAMTQWLIRNLER